MYFESLIVDFDEGSIVDASITDDVFVGATVAWNKLPRAELAFVLQRLRDALEHWGTTSPDGSVVTIHGEFIDGAPLYTASVGATSAPAWQKIAPSTQERILAELNEILAIVHGILVIT